MSAHINHIEAQFGAAMAMTDAELENAAAVCGARTTLASMGILADTKTHR